VWIDALTQKVRQGGRTVNVHCLVATGVNADGYQVILGIDVTSSEDGAGWLAFLRGLAARRLSGVAMVTSDDHRLGRAQRDRAADRPRGRGRAARPSQPGCPTPAPGSRCASSPAPG
jgi:hypothetical protein